MEEQVKGENKILKKTVDILKKVGGFFKNSLNHYYYMFLFLSIIYTIISLIIILYPSLGYDTFYNNNTDDVVQYYPYIYGFFRKIKTGTLSMYDVSLYGGASFFSSVYYIPIDLFLGVAFLLSFFCSVELSYFISLVLKIACGGFILYFVLKRKGIKPLVCTVVSIIYFVSGITETCFVFPVFLGIVFYAPLAMLIVDAWIDKKGLYSIFIPLFCLQVVIFDFYIAYMLIAFMCIYYVIETSRRIQKFFLFTKEFWINLAMFMALVLIGVLISLFFLLPSAFYVLNESSRTDATKDYYWYYSTIPAQKSDISLRHYFQMFVNYFTPNVPFHLCLIKAGDYIREHASLYMTSGGIIYLFYFFFLGGKKNHILKFWVILFNLLFCIPLVAMIMTLQPWAYARWFFIPFMINLYAMALGMNENNFKVGKNKYLKFMPMMLLLPGLFAIMYIYFKEASHIGDVNFEFLSFHYYKWSGNSAINKELYFDPIMIGSMVFIGIYLILLISAFLFELLKLRSNVFYRLMPVAIGAEAIYAGVIAFSNVGSTSYSVYLNEMEEQIEYLEDNMGYNLKDGYRINLDTNCAKWTTNTNILFGNTNPNRFFQSFYNTPLNDYEHDIHNSDDTGWSRSSIHGYTLFSGPMFNTKYVVGTIDYNYFRLPKGEKLYTEMQDGQSTFYRLDSLPAFIVYDQAFTYENDSNVEVYGVYEDGSPVMDDGKPRKSSYRQYDLDKNKFVKDVLLLDYAYIKSTKDVVKNQVYKDVDGTITPVGDPTIVKETTSNNTKKLFKHLNDDQIYYYKELSKQATFSSVYKTQLFQRSSNYKSDTYVSTYAYNIIELEPIKDQLSDYDGVYIETTNQALDHMESPYYYFDYSDTNLYNDSVIFDDNYRGQHFMPMHYNVGYFNLYQEGVPNRIAVKMPDSIHSSMSFKIYAFKFDNTYYKFLNQQNQYTNRDYYLDGSHMHIEFDNENTKPLIVKTAYTYSDDWRVKDNKYETCNINGGFLGILIPENSTGNINIDLEFVPDGYETGLKISSLGILLFFITTAGIILYGINQKRKYNNLFK